jgi:hypothetical protein
MFESSRDHLPRPTSSPAERLRHMQGVPGSIPGLAIPRAAQRKSAPLLTGRVQVRILPRGPGVEAQYGRAGGS